MKSFEQIDAYLESELTEVDRQAFEAEMAQNPSLAYAVRLAQFNRRKRHPLDQAVFLRRLSQLRAQLQPPPGEVGE